jgi:hypothetical protein
MDENEDRHPQVEFTEKTLLYLLSIRKLISVSQGNITVHWQAAFR